MRASWLTIEHPEDMTVRVYRNGVLTYTVTTQELDAVAQPGETQWMTLVRAVYARPEGGTLPSNRRQLPHGP